MKRTSKLTAEYLFADHDPSARKHGGNPASVAAHDKVAPGKQAMYDRILAYIRSRGDKGATVHEVCDWLTIEQRRQVTPNMVSGRLSEMRWAGLVKETGERRGGAAVLVEAKCEL